MSDDRFDRTNALLTAWEGADGNDDIDGSHLPETIRGGAGQDILNGGDAGDTLVGDSGNDTLDGDSGNDLISGGSGGDSLLGDFGDDTLEGGSGNDSLNGGHGDDLYVYGRGDGTDRITEVSAGSGIDTLHLTDGLTLADFRLVGQSGDLLLVLTDGSGEIRLADQSQIHDARIETLILDDGTTIDLTGPLGMQGGDGDDLITSADTGDTVSGGAGGDNLDGLAGDDILFGGSGRDTLEGDGGNDLLQGGSGADSLFGDAGDDTIQGGSGNDDLAEGFGDDLYIYNRGDGFDRIDGRFSQAGGFDTLQFGAGIAVDDITLTSDGSDLRVRLRDGTGEVLIEDQMVNVASRIEQLRFADGTTVDLTGSISQTGNDSNEILRGNALDETMRGSNGGDLLEGRGGDDILFGDSGNDNMSGDDGADRLFGGTGNDTLDGDDGNDTLDGGSGTDQLRGLAGDDTYIFDRGSFITVSERFTGSSGFDVIEVAAGISLADIRLSGDSSRDLFISLRDGTGQVRVDGNFRNVDTRVELLRLADGTEIDLTAGIAFSGDDANNGITTSDFDDTITGEGGNDIINGQSGADVIDGGAGNDNLSGQAGADVLTGGTGDDTLNGGLDDDTYVYRRGDGTDRISDVSGTDTIQFAAGIAVSDVLLQQSGNALLLNLSDGSGGLRLDNQFLSTGTALVEFARFADGTVVDLANGLRPAGLAIDGGDAVENLTGAAGDDTITGGAGSDVLTGQAGQDTLQGGIANDTLRGGADDDVYRYSIGDGTDQIDEQLSGGFDVLELGEGITPSDIRFHAGGTDLFVVLDGALASAFIQIHDQFAPNTGSALSRDSQVEVLRFADGTIIDLTAPLSYRGDDANDLMTAQQQNDTLSGLAGNDSLRAGFGDDLLIGGTGNDSLQGDADDDLLQGGEGADCLFGGDDDDTLTGGGGNDSLLGDAGDDTFIFGRGDGFDTIAENSLGSGFDVIQLADGIAAADIRLSYVSSNFMLLTLRDGTGGITINGQFNALADADVELLRFADGTTIDLTGPLLFEGTDGNDALDSDVLGDTLLGGAGNDDLDGFDGNDVLDGEGGNDTLEGGNDADTLLGGSGSDSLRGNGGDDRLIGGSGNDTLDGDLGDDTYVYARGDGFDVIRELSSGAGLDVIELAAGIGLDDFRLAIVSNSDLVIQLLDGSGQIVIDDQFGTNIEGRIEILRLADGTEIDLTGPLRTRGGDGDDFLDSSNLGDTLLGGDGADDLDGFGGDDRLEGESGADNLDGDGGNDTLIGGSGNDTLAGNSDADDLTGGRGNDLLQGDVGDDIYRYGRGDGFDTINEDNSFGGGIDRIVLGAGIDVADIRLTSNGNNLELLLADGTGSITIISQFVKATARIEELAFADGTIIDLTAPLVLQGGDGDDVITASLRDDTIAGSPGADRLLGRDGANVLQGDGGNDSLFGGGRDDLLEGGSGNDSLEGDSGDDTLRGDQGNDLLDGEFGDDLYVYGRGDGLDTIAETLSVASGLDTLLLTDGIAPGDVRLAVNGTSLTVFLNDGTGSVTVQGQSSPTTRIETLRFDDGTTIDLTGPLVLEGGGGNDSLSGGGPADTMFGGDGNDTINGLGDNVLFGGNGNDVIDANAGDDLLDGGSGDDTLFGDAGNDTLIAGAGNDTLAGSSGDDVYRYGRGDGDDVIQENRFSTGSGFDVIELGNGLTQSDIRLTSLVGLGNDLFIVILGTGESLAVDEHFSDVNHQVELLRFADGTEIDLTAGLLLRGSEASNFPLGSEFADTIAVAGGNDSIRAAGGDDRLLGEGGNDVLSGGTGNDTLEGGTGDDSLNGDQDNDTYLYARGDGTDRITETSGNDMIAFAAGITSSDISIAQSGNELHVSLLDGSGRIIVSSHFSNADSQVERIRFADGAEISLVDGIAAVGQTIGGTDASDALTGSAGNDTLVGGAGNDRLTGQSGNDRLAGDAGNDTLHGGAGDDTYVYRQGDGFDRIDELGGGGFDVLLLAGGLLPDDVRLEAASSDLFVVLEDDTGTIRIANHLRFNSSSTFDTSSRVEVLRFSDGSEIDLGGPLSLRGGAANDTMDGFILDDTVLGGGGNDRLSGRGGEDLIDGETGNDSISGGDGNDQLVGGQGADSLSGDNGDDLLTGGTGNDTLVGGVGDDRYVYNAGDGDDFIDEGSSQRSGTDTLELGAGIAAADIDLRISSNGADLFVMLRDGSGSIRIFEQFTDAVGAVERLLFADGSAIDLTAPLLTRGSDGNDSLGSSDLGDTLFGDGGNDFLSGFGGDDVLAGEGGDDFLRGGNGADTLDGGSGADNIDADAGDDDLIGGGGNDTLQGGFGDDRYVYARGDGFDVIDESAAANGFDLIDLVAGISTADVRLTVSNNDLLIVLTDGSGQIRIDDQFQTATPHVELLRFADGTLLSLDGVAGTAEDNSAPQAMDDVATVAEDESVLIDVLANDQDADGDSLSLVSVAGAANGSVSIASGQVRYTPDVDFSGSDSFTYTISDGDPQRTGTATVIVTVQPVNDAPVTVEDFVTIDEEGSAIIDVLANDFDVDGDTLSVVSIFTGTGAVSILADGRLSYTGAIDVTGADGIEYLVSDGNGGLTSGIVTVTLNPVNDAPLAVDDTATLAEDTTVTVDVLANDQDFDNADFGNGGLSVTTAVAANGSVVIEADGRLTYTPDTDFNGTDSIDYTIRDIAGATDSASVAITITPVNDAPTDIALDDTTVSEAAGQGDLVGRLFGDDPDGDDLTFTLLDNAGGRFVLDGNQLVVAGDGLLDAGQAATHQVAVEARDPGGLAVSEQFTINVRDVLDTATLDLDGNGASDALTDGLIALGHAFGAPIGQLTVLAASGSPGRDAATLDAALDRATADFLDVDGDGAVNALSDGLMVLGFLFGAPASQLAGFANPAGDRTTPQSINDFLEFFDVAA